LRAQRPSYELGKSNSVTPIHRYFDVLHSMVHNSMDFDSRPSVPPHRRVVARESPDLQHALQLENRPISAHASCDDLKVPMPEKV